MSDLIIAAVADLHFRAKRLSDIADAWKAAVKDMLMNRVNLCLIAGDVFDHPNISGREASFGTVYRAFIDPLMELKAAGVAVVVIDGNHDLATQGQKSALEPLRDLGVEYVDIPRVINPFSRVTVACLPWLIKSNKTETESLLKEFRLKLSMSDGLKIFLAHCEVAGTKTPQGYELIGGSFELTPGQISSVGADIVVCGHIHNRQGPYVGALTQLNFGEEGNPTGYDLYKISRGKLERTFQAMPSLRYLTFDVKDGEVPTCQSKDYYKIRFERDFTPDEIARYQDSPNVIIEKVVQRKATSRTEEELTAQDDTVSLLKAYIKNTPELIPMEPALVKVAKSLIEEIK